MFEVLSGSTGKFSVANDSVKIGGTIDVKTIPRNDQSRVEITSPDGRFSIGMWVYNDGRTLVSCRNTSGWSNVSFANVGSGSAAVIGGNIYVDGSGYLKNPPDNFVYPAARLIPTTNPKVQKSAVPAPASIISPVSSVITQMVLGA